MRLSGEDGEPHIERGNKDDCSKARLEALIRRREDLLEHKQWQRKNCQNEPDVEVEGQIPEIKVPRLSAVQLWASSRRENVVFDDVPGYHDNLFIEEDVEEKISALSLSVMFTLDSKVYKPAVTGQQ